MYRHKFSTNIGFLLIAIAAPSIAAAQSLETFYWRAVSLNGENLNLEASQIPHIAFHKETSRIAGFGGCNRFFALYQEKDSALSITVMGGGRSQCPDQDGLEQSFLGVLQGTQSYQLEGNKLHLLREDAVLGEFLGVER